MRARKVETKIKENGSNGNMRGKSVIVQAEGKGRFQRGARRSTDRVWG